MPQLNLKPTHKLITNYYKALAESGQLSLLHEGAVAPHFAVLLRACAAPLGWTLQEQYPLPRPGQHPIRLDGALLDAFSLRHGVWEAKDRDDDLEQEARAKFRAGYPQDNILFQNPTRALLYQDGRVAFDGDITDPEQLVAALKQFFAYEPPHYEQWQEAVAEFKDKVPELAQSLLALIEKERRENKRFVAAFDDFAEMARQAINPQHRHPGRRRDAHPAPADGAHLPPRLQQPRLRPAQRHRPRDRARHHRPDQPLLQPRGVPGASRPLLRGDRGHGGDHQRLPREAELSQHRL
jgi:hypothetical protein